MHITKTTFHFLPVLSNNTIVAAPSIHNDSRAKGGLKFGLGSNCFIRKSSNKFKLDQGFPTEINRGPHSCQSGLLRRAAWSKIRRDIYIFQRMLLIIRPTIIELATKVDNLSQRS